MSDLEWLYSRLEDNESRDLLVSVIAYRLLGEEKIKLPLSTAEYWEELDCLAKAADRTKLINAGISDWSLSSHDLSPLGYPINLYTRAPAIMAQFKLQQYCCNRIKASVRSGDVVVDGGGCFGDTALYFAHLAGKEGQVFSFEFIESNLKVFSENLKLNPDYTERISILRNPLWDKSGVPMYVKERGPASTVSLENFEDNTDVTCVETISIDDLATRHNLSRIDFIKMDIEGAEFAALNGALNVIRRDTPRLALCIYHSPVDFIRLARLIDEQSLGYRFAIGHFTAHQEETILFACAD